MKPARAHEVVVWAAQQIRELDEVGRSMIPAFDSMNSDEMALLKDLELLGKELSQGRWKRG